MTQTQITSTTNDAGIEFHLGDHVTIKGSSIPRRISKLLVQDDGVLVEANRTDGGCQRITTYTRVPKLNHLP